MVVGTTASQRVDLELRCIELMLADLPELAKEWDELGEGERVSWSLDWDQLMGALRVTLQPAYSSDAMAPAQRARYQDLPRSLAKALPTIERLNLYPPPVPLDA